MPEKRPPDEPLESLPSPRFGEDLKALYRTGIEVPREIDRKTILEARARLGDVRGGARRRPRIVRWVGGAAAAAAAVGLVLLGLWATNDFGGESGDRDAARNGIAVDAARAETDRSERSVRREDLDGDGQVDIVDAFLLARRAEGAGALDREWDFNADGTVDRRDADALAMAVVRLR